MTIDTGENLRWYEKRGYLVANNIYHPDANAAGIVYKHRLIAADALGEYLPKEAVVHHIDGNGLNNNNENLVILANNSHHLLIHIREKAYKATGDPNYRKCRFCKEWDKQSNLRRNNAARSWHHKSCVNAYERDRRKKFKAINANTQ